MLAAPPFLVEVLADALPPLPPSCLPTVTSLKGGSSNRTFCVQWGDERYVIRAAPIGASPLTHDVRREFRALRLLGPHFPLAPRVLHFCTDTRPFATPFFVMEWRNGEAMLFDPPKTFASTSDHLRTAVLSFVDALAQLHAIPVDSPGIRDLGTPKGFVVRQLRGWIERWKVAAPSESNLDVEVVARWLGDHLPVENSACVLHNDYKPDNVLLRMPTLDAVTAVLDWELCTLGDPMVDVGLLAAYWPDVFDNDDRRSIGVVPFSADLPSRSELVAHYARRTRFALDGARYHEVLGLFKISVLLQQLAVRPDTPAQEARSLENRAKCALREARRVTLEKSAASGSTPIG